MGGAEHEQQARLLSNDDKAIIAEGLRAALNQSHTELAEACSRYMQQYNVSYECLRELTGGELPNYLAGISVDSTSPEAKRLSNKQVAAFLAAYRDALMGPRRHAATEHIIADYAVEYTVPQQLLRAIVKSDRRRHQAQYRALEHIGASADLARRVITKKTKKFKMPGQNSVNPLRGKPDSVSVSDYVGRSTYCPHCHRDFDTSYIPIHESGATRCRGSERFAVSQYTIYLQDRHLPEAGAKRRAPTVGGGLPGLGRRR